MIIKNSSLTFLPTPPLPLVYFLIGHQPFQCDLFAQAIRKAWSTTDRLNREMSTIADWEAIAAETATYSFFGSKRLFELHIEKKSLDETAKRVLNKIIQQADTSILVLVKAPNLSVKALEAYTKLKSVQVIWALPPSTNVIKKWIQTGLKQAGFDCDQQGLSLIAEQYEGNEWAVLQLIERLRLSLSDPWLSTDTLESFLIPQSAYLLFDLPACCLQNDPTKALRLLKQACLKRQELTLILWVITQTVRILLRLIEYKKNKQPLDLAVKQFKLWPSQLTLYQAALDRYDTALLQTLHGRCSDLDKKIKRVGEGEQAVLTELERLVFQLCAGK